MLHTEIPDRTQVGRLLAHRGPCSVSIYIATDPVSSGEAERVEFKNLAAEAVQQLRDTGVGASDLAPLQEEMADLVDDDAFWRYQARSLATFATPASLVTFRLPNRLLSNVEVADRFFVKPLLHSVTFPQVALVLALAQNSVRPVEVTADGGAVGGAGQRSAHGRGERSRQVLDRRPVSFRTDPGSGRREGSDARLIEQALRPVLAGKDVPLILAGTEPMESIYRSVNSYPGLVATSIQGNPEGTTDAALAVSARTVLDEVYESGLAERRELWDLRTGRGRTLTDVGDVARAATLGAVDTVLVDIDTVVPGTVDEDTGAVTFAPESATTDGAVDEIARRVWLNSGRVLAVREDEVPAEQAVAAILRYAT